MSIEDALEKIIAEAESLIINAEKTGVSESEQAAAAPESGEETLTEVLPGFPEKVEGEIVFADGDNLSTDGVYPGKCKCLQSYCFGSDILLFRDHE
jgi:homoaconitate hydratase